MTHAGQAIHAATATASANSTDASSIDATLGRLADHASEFSGIPPAAKAALLRECLPLIQQCAAEWVERGCKAKGLSLAEATEEWLVGPLVTARIARLTAETLEAFARTGRGPKTKIRQDAEGRTVCEVFPAGGIDSVLFTGFRGEIRMEEGLSPADAADRQLRYYKQPDHDGEVALVLGAGNVSSIPPTDALTMMFNEGCVCIIKMNPVNEWVGPFIERAFRPLISRGYLAVVYGGVDVGKYLVDHELVGRVHITGSDKAHDAIVYGTGTGGAKRKEIDQPCLDKPVSSELGNISPVAIVPYDYSDKELWFQARNVATMLTNNASFNCNAAKMLITSSEWSQRDRFFEMIERALAAVPTRDAYYPGAFERYSRLTADRDRVTEIGQPSSGQLPWTLIRGLEGGRDDIAFTMEPFCAVLSEVTMGTRDPVEFLSTVTAFMNDTLWGTLNACIVIHPKLERDPTVGKALERSIRDLRYGTIGINHWPAIGYGLGTLPWGGHPSATRDNIQSGLGWVHNAYMFEGIEKTVIRGALVSWPHPVWFCDNFRGAKMAPELVAIETMRSWTRVPGLVIRAIL